MLEHLRRFFQSFDPGPRLVVAVSGGADSTALLVALAELALPFELLAVHVNHHLRAEASDADETFVRTLCAERSIGLTCADGTLVREAVRDRGVEAAAREIRYARLRELAASNGARFIATAHHQRDRVETLLMRLVTGSSPFALAGPRSVTHDLVRPMLEVRREEIDRFLRERDITPRVDASNADPRFLRNRIHKELLPLLTNIAPRAEDAVGSMAQQLAELERDWRTITAPLKAETIRREEDRSTIDLRLAETPWLFREAILTEITRLDPEARDLSSEDLRRIASASAHRLQVTDDVEALRTHTTLTLLRVAEPAEPFDVELRIGHEVRLSDGRVFGLSPASPTEPLSDDGQQLLELPRDCGTLRLRSRRNGDRFQPLGGPEKKLKDFLIDRKVPRQERDRLALLVVDDVIAVVAGIEVSERFKVGGEGHIYRLTWRWND